MSTYTQKIAMIKYLFLFSISFQAFTQSPIDKYLKTALSDPELVMVESQQKLLMEPGARAKLLSEIEVRIRSSQFNPEFEDYRLRFGFLNPFQASATQGYNEALKNELDAYYNLQLTNIIKQRYHILIAHYFNTQQLKLSNSKLELIDNQISFYTASPELKLTEILRLKEDRLKLLVNLLQIEADINELEAIIQQQLGQNEVVQWKGLEVVSLEELDGFSSSIDSLQITSVGFLLAKREVISEQKKLKLDKAKSWSNIGFIQPEYDIGRGDNLNDHLGFQIGVSIPFVNSDKPEFQRDKMALLKDERRRDAEEETSKWQFQIQRNRLTQLLSMQKTIINERGLIAKTQDSTFVDIKAAVALKEFELTTTELLIEGEFSLLKVYIELLAIGGFLIRQPFINYLVPNKG